MNDLYEDILKARKIPSPSEANVTFRRKKKSEQSTRSKKTNQRNIRQPRNMKLLGEMLGEDKCLKNKKLHYQEEKLDEHAISSSIQAICGSMDHSKESLKNFVNSLRSKKNLCVNENSSCEDHDNQSKIDEETKTEEEVLKQSGLLRNGAIKGLLKQKIISVNDIQLPNHIQRQSPSNKENDIGMYPCFVPHPEESDVLVRPLQAYENLDKTFQDIDFTVTHVGKKQIITPRQFYLDVGDNYFAFKKGDIN